MEAHVLAGAEFRPATLCAATGEVVDVALMVVAEATDDLVDVAASRFVAAHPGLDVVEGRATPATMADLRERRRNLEVRPEMAGWTIAPTTLALRGHADLFRLPLERSVLISGALNGSLGQAGIAGLATTLAPYEVTIEG